ncbi:UDP-glucose dehydrogenase family protein [Methanobrevibacter curvatus]|uniref:UDP-glucose 6-dehydrogenase n=1 Tax=Methanobrevibacter curvatus TaxID=49547 RepID=A0A166A1T5_9EURY|nr:UDP-glucose/GDP-mannose dehydrogenase family protein [Methanobrevibacter curvatus]KZX11458.1 UDP-glucose 6-dehydrogenase YwqF [Methanobrevibacter curvatus]
MNITVIGTGYVGLVTGTCFSDMGNKVYCVDIIEEKIEDLKKGIIPIYENDLEEMVVKNYKNGNLLFTTNLEEGIKNSNICFIAVGTPMAKDRSADLTAIYKIAKNLGEIIDHDMIVVTKSTVPVGTGDKIKEIIAEEFKKLNKPWQVHVVSNPEFLKEGTAVADSMRPDRVVIGSDDEKTIEILKELYYPFVKNHDRFIIMDIRSAEMSKYASNAMLATRISFMNEMAMICEKTGADVNKVRLGVGSDSRIGYSFLYAGCGYGGSCFPKDVQALIKVSENYNYTPKILKEVENINYEMKKILFEKIKKYFLETKGLKDLKGLKIAIWGLSFKPGTDDMRESTSVVLIKELISSGVYINSYDPKAVNEAKKILNDQLYKEKISYFNDKYEATEDCDGLVLVTEWNEFRSPDFKILENNLKNKVIFDGRNQYNNDLLKNLGFKYYQIGVLEDF